MAAFKKENLKKLQIPGKNPGKRHTIMLVDDEPSLLKELGKLLESEYKVITALNGQEALDIIKKMDNPDEISLIISDQRMPGLSGVELLERLVVENIIPDAIRIILTGYMDIPVIIDAVNKANIYKFILKPYEPEDFMLTIKRALEVYDLREENKKLSLVDPLTGLGNKQYLQEFINRDIEKIKKDYENWHDDRTKPFPPRGNLAFLLLDLEEFKQANNIHNRKEIDKVLEQLGKMLKDHCRKSSDISVRWEGDKLVIVCRFIESTEAQKIAERLHQELLTQKIKLEADKDIELTCSIGFACYPFIPGNPTGIEWLEVIEIAGKALHAAREPGKCGCVGLMAVKDIKPGNLMTQIRENVKDLLDKGILKVLGCMPEGVSLVRE
jgi:two-component system cell cycle response regulator